MAHYTCRSYGCRPFRARVCEAQLTQGSRRWAALLSALRAFVDSCFPDIPYFYLSAFGLCAFVLAWHSLVLICWPFRPLWIRVCPAFSGSKRGIRVVFMRWEVVVLENSFGSQANIVFAWIAVRPHLHCAPQARRREPEGPEEAQPSGVSPGLAAPHKPEP